MSYTPEGSEGDFLLFSSYSYVLHIVKTRKTLLRLFRFVELVTPI